MGAQQGLHDTETKAGSTLVAPRGEEVLEDFLSIGSGDTLAIVHDRQEYLVIALLRRYANLGCTMLGSIIEQVA